MEGDGEVRMVDLLVDLVDPMVMRGYGNWLEWWEGVVGKAKIPQLVSMRRQLESMIGWEAGHDTAARDLRIGKMLAVIDRELEKRGDDGSIHPNIHGPRD